MEMVFSLGFAIILICVASIRRRYNSMRDFFEEPGSIF